MIARWRCTIRLVLCTQGYPLLQTALGRLSCRINDITDFILRTSSCSLDLEGNCTFHYKHSLCSFIGFTDPCRFLHGPRHARSVRSAWGTASSCELLMCIVDAHRQVQCAQVDSDTGVSHRKLLRHHERKAGLTGFVNVLRNFLHTDHKARYQGVQRSGRACFRPTARMEPYSNNTGPQQGMKLTECCLWTFTMRSDVTRIIDNT